MLKHIIEKQLTAFEKEWDYSMDYAREVLELGVLVLKKFQDAQAIGSYCEGISSRAHFGVKILAVMAGDCGPCVQLVTDMAAREGVPPEALAALVRGELEALPEDMRLPAEFTRALVARSEELPELRERMRERYGNEGLVSAAYGVINASMYPTLKYALGHGHACAKIGIGEQLVIPVNPLTDHASARVA